MALGRLIARVVNDPLGAPGSTPLYLRLPPVWDAAGGELIISHYSWDRNGNQDLKEKRDSPSRRSLREILQHVAGSSGAPLSDPLSTSKSAVEISAKDRDKPMARNLPKVKPKIPFFGVSRTDI
jgi:hypothetical protein